MPSATRRAWAPSCRSRSIRRSSDAEWSTVSARDVVRSATRCASRVAGSGARTARLDPAAQPDDVVGVPPPEDGDGRGQRPADGRDDQRTGPGRRKRERARRRPSHRPRAVRAPRPPRAQPGGQREAHPRHQPPQHRRCPPSGGAAGPPRGPGPARVRRPAPAGPSMLCAMRPWVRDRADDPGDDRPEEPEAHHEQAQREPHPQEREQQGERHRQHHVADGMTRRGPGLTSRERSPPHPHASRRVGAVGLAPPSIRVLAPPTAPRSPARGWTCRCRPVRGASRVATVHPPGPHRPLERHPPVAGDRLLARCSSPSPSAWPRPSPPPSTTDEDYRVGESGRAEALVHDGGLDGPRQRERRHRRSRRRPRRGGGRGRRPPELARRMGALDAVDSVAEPVWSPDRSMLLVEVLLAADTDDVAALQQVTADVADAHPDLRVTQAGEVSAGRRHQRPGGRGPGSRPRCSRCPSRWA